jgi:hypothetical protein
MRDGLEALAEPVTFTLIGAVSFPARFVGLALFALAVFMICRWHRYQSGAGSACLAGAAAFFSYSMFAMGVHHNHPHLIFLVMAATGLTSRRLQILVGTLTVGYVFNLLMLSGLGRFYGPRYTMLEPATHVISNLRMALGFDLTLLLALVHTFLYVWLMLSLPKELENAGTREGVGCVNE